LAGQCLPLGAGAEPQGAAGSPLAALRPFFQAVADRCREHGRAETDRLIGRHGKLLALCEPAFLGLPGQGAYPEPVELPAEAARMRLYTALAETFMAFADQERPASGGALPGLADAGPLRSQLAARRSRLLVLDDLQWADELTLGFLEFLVRTE